MERKFKAGFYLPPPDQTLKKLFAIGLSLCSAVLILGIIALAAELGFRLYLLGSDRRNPYTQAEVRKYAALREGFDPRLWEVQWVRYKKNASLQIDLDGETISVQTNSYGFRTHEFEATKPPGVYRIICAGGSTTVVGRTNEETYPALLETRLQEHYPGKRIEVLNFGVSRYGTPEAAQLSYESLRYSPDVILMYNGVNDLWWEYFIGLYERLPRWKRAFARSYLFQWFFWRHLLPPTETLRQQLGELYFEPFKILLRKMEAVHSSLILLTFVYPEPASLNAEQKYYFDFNIRTFWGRQMGTIPFIRLEPYLFVLKMYNSVLIEFCEANRVRYIDLAREFPATFDKFVDLCHFSQKGIESASRLLADSLAEMKVIK